MFLTKMLSGLLLYISLRIRVDVFFNFVYDQGLVCVSQDNIAKTGLEFLILLPLPLPPNLGLQVPQPCLAFRNLIIKRDY